MAYSRGHHSARVSRVGTAQCKTTAEVKQGCQLKKIYLTDNLFFLTMFGVKPLNFDPGSCPGPGRQVPFTFYKTLLVKKFGHQ